MLMVKESLDYGSVRRGMRVSSGITFYLKFVFPVIWITGFGAGVIGIWSGWLHGRGGETPPDFFYWIVPAGWICGSAFLIWDVKRYRRVAVGEGELLVSNYFREIAVPYSTIEKVRHTTMHSPQLIIVYLNRRTPLGKKIVFIPCGWPVMRRKHPIAAEIEGLAYWARDARA